MAAPHVAGAAALLWSVNPDLIGDLPQTQQLLTGTAVPRYSAECGDNPTARPNNVYGWDDSMSMPPLSMPG
jgi:subtilisin family serine protease